MAQEENEKRGGKNDQLLPFPKHMPLLVCSKPSFSTHLHGLMPSLVPSREEHRPLAIPSNKTITSWGEMDLQMTEGQEEQPSPPQEKLQGGDQT